MLVDEFLCSMAGSICGGPPCNRACTASRLAQIVAARCSASHPSFPNNKPHQFLLVLFNL